MGYCAEGAGHPRSVSSTDSMPPCRGRSIYFALGDVKMALAIGHRELAVRRRREVRAPGGSRTSNRAPVRRFPRIRRSLCQLSYRGIGTDAEFGRWNAESMQRQNMAERRGLAPQAGRLALVSTEARFARPVDAPFWSVVSGQWSFAEGAGACKKTKGERRRQGFLRTSCARNSSTIFQSAVPPSENWSRRGDSHSRGASARQFTKPLLSLLSHAGERMAEEKVGKGAEERRPSLTCPNWWVATVLPRALRFKRPLHRCNACNPVAARRRS